MAHWFVFNVLTILIIQTASTLTPKSLSQDLSLTRLLLRRQFELQTSDPSASTECFNTYLPQLQAAADQWSSNYADCYNDADNRRYNFIEQLEADQISINDSSNDICNYIHSCQNIKDALDYFKCFGNLSQNVVTEIYVISNNASDDASLLAQQLQGINSDLDLCTNDTQRVYVQQTAVIFDALEDCLIYGLDVSSSTAENVDMFGTMTTATDVEATQTDGSGNGIDTTWTTDETSTTNETSTKQTTYLKHATIPIMSV